MAPLRNGESVDELVLYRGISVPDADLDEVVDTIRSTGIAGNEGHWKFQGWDLRPHLDRIIETPSLTGIDDDGPPVVCACGDQDGAHFYACHHNHSAGNRPLVVKFSAETAACYVDCRDFLCTTFQFWDSRGIRSQAEVADVLTRLFGAGIDRYFSKAAATKEQAARIALCNAAAFDPAVIRDHYANRLRIGGRHRVVFMSAFFVSAPILPQQIIEVYEPECESAPQPDVTLDDVR
jgi:hypothetical protein